MKESIELVNLTAILEMLGLARATVDFWKRARRSSKESHRMTTCSKHVKQYPNYTNEEQNESSFAKVEEYVAVLIKTLHIA